MAATKILVRYNRRRVWVPQSWQDLTRRQFLAIQRIILERLYLTDQRIWIVRELLKMPRRLFRQVTADQLSDLVVLADFVYSDDVRLERNPLPWIIIRGRLFMAPKMHLEFLTVEEFARIDVALFHFHETKAIKYLYEVAAILYRPLSFRSWINNLFSHRKRDLRIKSLDTVARRTAFFEKYMPLHYQESIMFIYHVIHAHLKRSFPFVWRKPDDADDNQEPEPRNDYGWSEIVINMAGGKFGTIRETYRHYLLEVLLVLNYEIEKNHERNFNARFKH